MPVEGVSLSILENGRERGRDPVRCLVRVPDGTCLVLKFGRVQQRLVVWHSRACGRLVRGSCLLLTALPCLCIPVAQVVIYTVSVKLVPVLFIVTASVKVVPEIFLVASISLLRRLQVLQRVLDSPRLQLDFCRVRLLLPLLQARKYFEFLRQIKRRSEGIELAMDPLLYPAHPHLL